MPRQGSSQPCMGTHSPPISATPCDPTHPAPLALLTFQPQCLCTPTSGCLAEAWGCLIPHRPCPTCLILRSALSLPPALPSQCCVPGPGRRGHRECVQGLPLTALGALHTPITHHSDPLRVTSILWRGERGGSSKGTEYQSPHYPAGIAQWLQGQAAQGSESNRTGWGT